MRRRILAAATLSCSILFAMSCQDRSPVAPTPSATIDQFVQALRQRGLNVTLGAQLPRESNSFFSVPAQVVQANGAHLNVFEYSNAEAAATDASLVTLEGQFRTNLVTWISTPRFYRHDRLIVIYAGCAADITQALDATMGPPFVIGSTPCRR